MKATPSPLGKALRGSVNVACLLLAAGTGVRAEKVTAATLFA